MKWLRWDILLSFSQWLMSVWFLLWISRPHRHSGGSARATTAAGEQSPGTSNRHRQPVKNPTHNGLANGTGEWQHKIPAWTKAVASKLCSHGVRTLPAVSGCRVGERRLQYWNELEPITLSIGPSSFVSGVFCLLSRLFSIWLHSSKIFLCSKIQSVGFLNTFLVSIGGRGYLISVWYIFYFCNLRKWLDQGERRLSIVAQSWVWEDGSPGGWVGMLTRGKARCHGIGQGGGGRAHPVAVPVTVFVPFENRCPFHVHRELFCSWFYWEGKNQFQNKSVFFGHAFLLSHQDDVELERKKKLIFLNVLKVVKSLVMARHLLICLNLKQLGMDLDACFSKL